MRGIISITFVLVLTLVIIATSSLPMATGWTYAGPIDTKQNTEIYFSIPNGTVVRDSRNFTLRLNVIQNALDGIAIYVGVHFVSYKASWQDKPVVLYQYSIHDPSNLEDDDTPLPQMSLTYILNWKDIPAGPQYIEVTAQGGGYLTNGLWFGDFSGNASSLVHFAIGTPLVSSLSPKNYTYYTDSIPLNCNVEGDFSDLKYSIDNIANTTITGNTTLTKLPNGVHNLTFYVSDIAGNVAASNTIHFTVAVPAVAPLIDKSFNQMLIAIAVIIPIVIALIIYRIRHTKGKIINKQAKFLAHYCYLISQESLIKLSQGIFTNSLLSPAIA